MADLPIGSDEGAQVVELIQSSTLNKAAINASGEQLVNDATVSNDLALINANLTNGNQLVNLNKFGGTAVTIGQKTMAASIPVVFASDQTVASANLWVTGTAVAGTGVTVTLPAVASQFHYINTLEITAYTSAARIGAATPVLVTSTNIPGSPAWDFSSADAIGTVELKFFTFPAPVKSSTVNTNTTIVCPATTSVIWRINVSYYAAT